MFEKLFKKDTDDKEVERLTVEQLTHQETGIILAYRNCKHDVILLSTTMLAAFAEEKIKNTQNFKYLDFPKEKPIFQSCIAVSEDERCVVSVSFEKIEKD